MKIDRSQTPEYFVIDCKARFGLMHMPSGEFCGRAYFMTFDKRDVWETKFDEFLKKYPNASLLVDQSGEILDNLDDFPQRGGGFKVGDVVMINERDHGYCADKIIAIDPKKSTIEHPVDKGTVYQLESGNRFYWEVDNDLWYCASKTAFDPRVRRALPGEDQMTLEEKIENTKSLGM